MIAWTNTNNPPDEINDNDCYVTSFGTYEHCDGDKTGFMIDREDLESCLVFEDQAKFYKARFEELKPIEVIDSCECWYCDVRFILGAFVIGGALVWVAK